MSNAIATAFRICRPYVVSGFSRTAHDPVVYAKSIVVVAPGFHRDFLRQLAEPFVPRLDRVGPSWHFRNGKSAIRSADRKIRMRHDADVSGHPAVHVAAKRQHHFFGPRRKREDDSRLRLSDVEAVPHCRRAVNVVQQIVVVPDLQRLPDAHTNHPRAVHAGALFDHHRLGGNGCFGKRAIQPDKHVGDTAVSRHHR